MKNRFIRPLVNGYFVNLFGDYTTKPIGTVFF